ncbi:MAG: helix-turn-helix transcriptional regulator [Lachnospiraceae bacterium]|nr:helix-turn-helix transcriptional regulator [Lachnospiraceae bacterium]
MELQKSEIGLRIRMRRKECKFTGEYLAEMAGISPEFLRGIESGNRGMSLQTLSSLAHTLQTTTDYLLFGTANEEKYAILIQTLDQCPEDKLSHLITILDDILLYQSSISQNE